MPHVVIEEAGDLQGLYQVFTPIIHRAGSEILKVQEFFLARSGKDALLDSVAIENGVACTFFVQLKLHEKAITVRLLPATDPEKTPAVKKVMAHGGWIHSEQCTRIVAMARPTYRNI